MIGALVLAAAVQIQASDFALSLPAQVPAGVTTFAFVNKGAEPHSVRFLQLGAGKSFDDFVAWQKSGSPIPEWLVTVGGVGSVAPGMSEEYITSLAAGSYVVLCSYPSPDGTVHSSKGMYAALRVGPAASEEKAPSDPDLNLRLHDHGFQLSAPIEGGRKLWRVENTGSDAHQVLIIHLPEGVSEYQERGWFSGGSKGPRPGVPVGGVIEIPPDGEAWFRSDLKPGRYLLLCSVQEEEGRHYDLGMIYRFTVE